MNTNAQYFSWADCWVITGILCSTPDEAEIDLRALISAGDMLNHAIYSENELRDGFLKAQKKGLISIQRNRIKISKQGQEVRSMVRKMRGGLFSIVDNMQKKLNSKRTTLLDVPDDDIDPCSFINEKAVRKGYAQYSGNLKKR
jgi:hypothetical protein